MKLKNYFKYTNSYTLTLKSLTTKGKLQKLVEVTRFMETLQLEPNFIVTTNFLFTEYKSLQKDTFLH